MKRRITVFGFVPGMRIWVRRVCACSTVLLLWGGVFCVKPFCASAQCDTNQMFGYGLQKNADSSFATNISIFYQFEMVYDSGRTFYVATEFKKNSQRLHLENWCLEKAYKDKTTEELSDMSRTGTFMVWTGDTLSFYRELHWYNPITNLRDPTYYARDTLNFAVELINAGGLSRLALIDSLGILRRVPTGMPVLYGAHPIMAIVKYVVPSAFNGMSVFMRVHPYATGDGDNYLMRYDDFTGDMSSRLDDSVWQYRIGLYGGGLGKSVSTQLLNAGNAGDAQLTIVPNPAKDRVTIRFNAGTGKAAGNSTSVAIYDASGALIFIPCSGMATAGTAQYIFQQSGNYYIALCSGKKILNVQKISVSK